MKTVLNASWRSVASALFVLVAANACDSGTISGGNNKPVAGLRFSVQPAASSVAGSPFNVSVELLDEDGAKLTKATDLVTLSVTGGATLTGTTSAAATAGVATFNGLSVTKAGTGYTISASANGISASSSSFTVTPTTVNAAQSSVTFTPTSITTGATIAFTFTFKDQFGNALANKPVTVSSSLGGVTFTPSTGTTSAAGTFTSNMVATTAGNTQISATVDGTQIAVGTPISIAPPTTFTIATSSNPANGGTTTGGGTVTQGTSVTVVATPATGFTFTNWTEGGTAASTAASYTFTATANRTLVANFAASAPACPVNALVFPGSTTGSLSSTGCTFNGQPSAYYRFTTASTGAHTFSVTTSFTGPSLAILEDPPGSFIAFTNSAGTTAGTDWLLPAGTYQVKVASLTAPSGTFTLTGAAGSNDNTACTIRGLLVSVTVTQNLAATDCAYLTNDGSVEDRFAIFSNRQCQVSMTGSASLPPWIEIRDAANNVLQFAGAPTGSNTATLTRAACTSASGGLLLLIANTVRTVANGGTGAYTFSLTLSGPAALREGVQMPLTYNSPWLDLSQDMRFLPAGAPVKPKR